MTFEERLKQMQLPEMAIVLLPTALSEGTKRKLSRRDDMEELLRTAIREVDEGSVKTLETILADEMKSRQSNMR